jgi:hypothetical protein
MAESKKGNAEESQVISQEKKGFRQGWPAWLKQMPRLRFPPPDDNFQLIDAQRMEAFLATVDPKAAERIRSDLGYMEYELLRLFRKRDYEASRQQNRYRLFQISYVMLATLSALVGSLLALSLSGNRDLTPWLGFIETIVALVANFLATISGREPPLQLYMTNRRRAELLRREYFRYLMDLPPFDEVKGYEREMMLSRRAADINRGNIPDTEPARQ